MAAQPFDYVKAINKGVVDPKTIDSKMAGYVPFVVNRAFSYYFDTLLAANTLNKYPDIPHAQQYAYYAHSFKPRPRFAKWIKPQGQDIIATISEVMSVSHARASEIYLILTDQQITQFESYRQHIQQLEDQQP